MIDTGEIRKRLRLTIDRTRKAAAAQRAESDAAAGSFAPFVERTAAPVFRGLVQALRSEGYLFSLETPADAIRITSDRSAGDYIEITVDANRRPVALVARTAYTRGRRSFEQEHLVREGADFDAVTDEQLLELMLTLLEPFVER
jgi:hypothetical protein